jgi:16S rRNA U1498 N3-methylase RsmE
LPSIYLLEPVTKDTLVNLVESATVDVTNAFQTTTTAITILTKKRKIELTTSGYKLTSLGLGNFFAFRKTRSRIKWQDEKIEIDNLRLEILNLKNRNKKLKV